MPKFKKKPVDTIYEAHQWFPGKEIYGVHSEREATEGGNGFSPETALAFVTTIHGQTTKITEGDWVVTEPDGIHHYPVKPDIFETNYQAIDG